jgi:hypothetical protein
MSKNKLTLAKIETLASNDVFIANLLRRIATQTYEEFLDVLYDDLMLAVHRLEQNPQHYREEHEDATTQRLLDILFGMSYTASHDMQSGGNVDVTIEFTQKRMRWIGEAKRFNSVSDMRAGYLQLATRYTPGAGAVDSAYGGLIGYLRRKNAAGCMDTWKSHFATEVETDAKFEPCSRRGSLGFISETSHQALGIPFKVWHLCVVLYFQPQDKSGLAAEKYK